MDPRSPTLDQIAVFLAIVETGSFAAAGRKLGRATSAYCRNPRGPAAFLLAGFLLRGQRSGGVG